MKQFIYILFLSALAFQQIIPQQYHAGVRVEDLYWYNNPLHEIPPGSGVYSVEWQCVTKAVLWFGDEEIEPNPDWSYTWSKNPSGNWVYAGSGYYITPDGNPGDFYQVKVHINTHTGINVESNPVDIGYDGVVQLLEVKAKLQNGASLGNSYTYFQNFTDPHWRQGRFDEGTQKNVLNLTQNENSLIRINPYDLPAYYEKFNRWNSPDQYINYDEFYIDNSSTLLNGNFKQRVNNIIVQANFPEYPGCPADLIGFKDPWLMEFVSDNLGSRNKGEQALFKYFISINFSDPEFDYYKGVFLNQDPQQGLPNYSVRSPVQSNNIYLQQTGGYHKFYFQNWSSLGTDPLTQNNIVNGYYETPVVFRSANAVVNANLKGTQLSNEQSGYSSGSQRKLVESVADGYLHNVYSSLGHVWYERSTDGGSTWTIANGGNYIDNGEGGKLPAIADGNDNEYYYDQFVLIAYQEKYGNNYKIMLKGFNNGVFTSEKVITTSSQAYTYDANPVVAFSRSEFSTDRFMVVYQTNSGLGYSFGYVAANGNINIYESNTISSTDQNSSSPTIAARMNVGAQGDFYLAWQQSTSQINYKKIHYIDDEITNDPTPTNVTYNSGFSQYYSPSILVMETDNIARLCWVGSRYVCAGGGVGDCVQVQEYKILFKGINNLTRQWVFGTSGQTVSSPNINKKNNNATNPYYAFAWSESSGENKFADNTLSTVRTLNTNGQNIQVVNGSDKNTMYAMSFDHNSGSPYYLKMSESLGSFYMPQKIQLNAFHSGREGVVSIDSADFYFALGDITVDNQPIDFVDIADTIAIDNLSILNDNLISEPIGVSDNSNFVYSVQYGINDSLSAVQAMIDDRFISFKVQLLDAGTGEIIGDYDDVTYNAENIFEYGNISYQVNTQGIGNRTVRLKLVVGNNFNCDYTMSKIYSDASVLAKSNFKQIDFSGSNPVKTYELTQNYPNPFNPSTTIKYQIPQSGNVTVKVFDILGAEVATLVNEFQNKGRYEVNFDASKLSSGVYIYRLQVNDYSASKKMVLMK